MTAEEQRALRQADPERFRAYWRKSYSKNREKRLASCRAYRERKIKQDPEFFRRSRRARYERDGEAIRSMMRDRYRENNQTIRAERNNKYASDPRPKMLTASRLRAKVLDIPHSICKADIVIPKICPVLGIPLKVSRKSRGPQNNSPTLDRINPALGYVAGNVIVISWRANRLKSDATIEELIALAKFYANKRKVNLA